MMQLENIQNNFHVLKTSKYYVYFSYETPIAFIMFEDGRSSIYVSRNEWSRTTGKHLNIIKRDVAHLCNEQHIEIPHDMLLSIINKYTK